MIPSKTTGRAESTRVTIGVAGKTKPSASVHEQRPNTTPPIAPSMVFFGLMAGASGRGECTPGVVLRGIADDNRRDEHERALPAGEGVQRHEHPKGAAPMYIGATRSTAASWTVRPCRSTANASQATTNIERSTTLRGAGTAAHQHV